MSVVIPVFNEEAGIEPLLLRLMPVLDGLAVAWTILFVDDGSTDGTLAQLRAWHARDRRITALSLSRNFGKETALAAGLRYAPGDAVVLMDADLQHPPEVIPKLVARWREGFTLVFAQREDRDTDPLARRVYSRAFYSIFARIAGTKLPAGAGDFLLFDRKAVAVMNRLGERTRFSKGLYAWIGFRSTMVPFAVHERTTGASKWSFGRLARFALDGIVSFSTIPLKVWSYIGGAISLFAFGYALYFLILTLVIGTDLPGFPSLIVSVMFFAGIQLLSLGIIGEYLARVYEEVKARPLYVVAEEIGLTKE